MADCYDMNVAGAEPGSFTLAGYDGATTYGPIQVGVDYDVGSSAGQFMFVITSDQWAAFAALDSAEQA